MKLLGGDWLAQLAELGGVQQLMVIIALALYSAQEARPDSLQSAMAESLVFRSVKCNQLPFIEAVQLQFAGSSGLRCLLQVCSVA